MKRLIIGVVLLAVVIGAASSGSKHKATTSVSASVPEATPPTTTASPSQPTSTRSHAVMTHCDQNISVNAHATCGFADNVFRAYAQALHASGTQALAFAVEATSPVTGRSYTMSCHAHGGTTSTAICTGAVAAAVSFPVLAAQEYQTPTPATPSSGESSAGETPSEPESEPGSGEPESNSGESDEVGSTSHATDAQFCSEHECIGSFETEEGTIVECSDGSYSHAGGISGACSHHGGEN
jgi:hypothetical protein